MYKGFRILLGLILISQLLLGSLFIVCLAPPADGVQGLPTVNIALTEQSKTAHVGPGDNGTVTFDGIVSVTMNQATRVVVSLTAEDTWGSSVVEPSSILFSSNGDKPFSVSVKAPPGTSFTDTGTVTVTGRWTMYPGGLSGPANPQQGAVGRIDIAQYFQFSLESDLNYQEAKPGSKVRFDLIINNEGNWIDSFSIELVNDNELIRNGIDCKLSNSNIEILEKSNETVSVNLETSSGSDKLGTYYIHVKVWSNGDSNEGLPPQTFDFSLKLTNNPRSDANIYQPDPGTSQESEDEPEGVLNIREKENKLLTESDLIMILIGIIIVLIILALLGWMINRSRSRNRSRKKRVKIVKNI